MSNLFIQDCRQAKGQKRPGCAQSFLGAGYYWTFKLVQNLGINQSNEHFINIESK